MSKEEDNKAIVGRWFTEFWGDTYNPAVIDELAAPDMLFQYSWHFVLLNRRFVRLSQLSGGAARRAILRASPVLIPAHDGAGPRG